MFIKISFLTLLTFASLISEAPAQDRVLDQVDLSIAVENNPFPTLPMFAFVKGRLSGMVPGVITLPSHESVSVEIGIAQLNLSPLYSFNFGPGELKAQKVDIVTTNIDRGNSKKVLILHKDIVRTIELTRIHDGVYDLKLPSNTYLAINKFMKENEEFGVLPVKRAEDYGLSSHLVYNKGEQRTVSMGDSASWSGTNIIAFGSGGIGYVSEKQKWTIKSKPEGADIYTDIHPDSPEAKTDSTVQVTKSISAYALLKMHGYHQCVIQMDGYQQCTDKDCIKSEGADGSLSFTCNLTKVR